LGNDLEIFLITQYIFLEQYNNKDNVPGVFARGVQALNPGQAPPSAAFSPRAAGARSLPAATTQQRRRIPHDWPAEELDSVCVCRLLSSARNLDCAASTNFIPVHSFEKLLLSARPTKRWTKSSLIAALVSHVKCAISWLVPTQSSASHSPPQRSSLFTLVGVFPATTEPPAPATLDLLDEAEHQVALWMPLIPRLSVLLAGAWPFPPSAPHTVSGSIIRSPTIGEHSRHSSSHRP
jgi:hypothetical protein